MFGLGTTLHKAKLVRLVFVFSSNYRDQNRKDAVVCSTNFGEAEC